MDPGAEWVGEPTYDRLDGGFYLFSNARSGQSLDTTLVHLLPDGTSRSANVDLRFATKQPPAGPVQLPLLSAHLDDRGKLRVLVTMAPKTGGRFSKLDFGYVTMTPSGEVIESHEIDLDALPQMMVAETLSAYGDRIVARVKDGMFLSEDAGKSFRRYQPPALSSEFTRVVCGSSGCDFHSGGGGDPSDQILAWRWGDGDLSATLPK